MLTRVKWTGMILMRQMPRLTSCMHRVRRLIKPEENKGAVACHSVSLPSMSDIT